MGSIVAIDTKRMSVDVEVSVKIDRLMDDGYCRTRVNQVKQNMVFLLRLYDVKYSVNEVNGWYIFNLVNE